MENPEEAPAVPSPASGRPLFSPRSGGVLVGADDGADDGAVDQQPPRLAEPEVGHEQLEQSVTDLVTVLGQVQVLHGNLA